ncbi:hypothetical protein ACP70R_049484 [Stipagrostis hirtigluma subsp. patula]
MAAASATWALMLLLATCWCLASAVRGTKALPLLDGVDAGAGEAVAKILSPKEKSTLTMGSRGQLSAAASVNAAPDVAAVRAAMKAQLEKKIKSLTPEQRSKLEKAREAQAAIKKQLEEKIKSLTPEERSKLEKALQAQAAAKKQLEEKIKSLTPEQKAKMESALKVQIALREKLAKEKKNLTPEQKAELKKKLAAQIVAVQALQQKDLSVGP